MPLAAGEMSIHNYRLAHASGPNTSDDRRIGVSIHYMPPETEQIVGGWDCATLVRGETVSAISPRLNGRPRLSIRRRSRFMRKHQPPYGRFCTRTPPGTRRACRKATARTAKAADEPFVWINRVLEPAMKIVAA